MWSQFLVSCIESTKKVPRHEIFVPFQQIESNGEKQILSPTTRQWMFVFVVFLIMTNVFAFRLSRCFHMPNSRTTWFSFFQQRVLVALVLVVVVEVDDEVGVGAKSSVMKTQLSRLMELLKQVELGKILHKTKKIEEEAVFCFHPFIAYFASLFLFELNFLTLKMVVFLNENKTAAAWKSFTFPNFQSETFRLLNIWQTHFTWSLYAFKPEISMPCGQERPWTTTASPFFFPPV